MVTFQKEFERGKMYLTVTRMCSAAGHFGIFLKMLNPSLMTASSGVMDIPNLATGYWIQFLHLQLMMITWETEAQDDATNDEAPVNSNLDQHAQAEQVPPSLP